MLHALQSIPLKEMNAVQMRFLHDQLAAAHGKPSVSPRETNRAKLGQSIALLRASRKPCEAAPVAPAKPKIVSQRMADFERLRAFVLQQLGHVEYYKHVKTNAISYVKPATKLDEWESYGVSYREIFTRAKHRFPESKVSELSLRQFTFKIRNKHPGYSCVLPDQRPNSEKVKNGKGKR